MSLLDKLDRKYGRHGVPYVTEVIILGQVLLTVPMMAAPERVMELMLTAEALLAGEVWRLLTFVFVPTIRVQGGFGLIFLFFMWYIFFLFGTSLEQAWGSFRYNLYLLIAWFATVVATLLMPLVGAEQQVMQNYFIGLSVFLAFAYLNPDFEVRLFLVWPVAVKWLALITGVFIAGAIIAGPMASKLAAAAAVANFFVFFTVDIVRRLRGARRRAVARMEAAALADEPFHRCNLCGATDKSDPSLEFRYCPDCAGTPCYCEKHIFDHEHVTEGAERNL